MTAARQAPPHSASPHPTTNSQSGLGRVLSRLPQRWGRIRCSRRRGMGEEGDLPERGPPVRGAAVRAPTPASPSLLLSPARSFAAHTAGQTDHQSGARAASTAAELGEGEVQPAAQPPVVSTEYQRVVEKAEEIFFSVGTQLGRYAITKMSSGVVIGVGFQLSGGDSQMHELIWYSWLGGVILGTMIGSNSVLEEHCKVGPRNVVITGRQHSQNMKNSS